MRSPKFWAIPAVALIGSAAAGFVWWHRSEQEATVEASRWAMRVDSTDPSRGPRQAAVTIVEFCDFEVPQCKDVASTLSRVVKEFAPDVRWVFKEFPQERARTRGFIAAHFARHAFATGGNSAFWTAHDKLLAVTAAVPEPIAPNLAAELDLRWDDVQTAITEDSITRPMRSNLALALASGVSGVPFLFVNGRPIEGAPSFEKLSEIVREELGRARRLLAKSTDQADPYTQVTRGARTVKPDPKVVQGPPTQAEKEAAKLEKRAKLAGTPAPGPSGRQPRIPLPRVVPSTGGLTESSLSQEEIATLRARGFDPSQFVRYANVMNERRRQEAEVRAERNAKGLPGGNVTP